MTNLSLAEATSSIAASSVGGEHVLTLAHTDVVLEEKKERRGRAQK